MNRVGRREFLAAITGVTINAISFAEAEQVTLIDVSDVHAPDFISPTRIFADGREIGRQCYRAELYSDGSGIAYCLKRNADGHFYYDQETHDVAREMIHCRRMRIVRPTRRTPRREIVDVTSPSANGFWNKGRLRRLMAFPG